MSSTTLDGAAVQAVAALAQDAVAIEKMFTEEIGDCTFSTKPLHRVNTDPALPKPLEFYTLGGLVDYLKAEAWPETEDDGRPFVHVVSPTRVDAVSRLVGDDRHLRRHVASAVCKTAVLRGFTFDRPLPMEQLNIALQTCFHPSGGDIAELRRFCAGVRSTSEIGTDDDGVSQTVQARRGIAAVIQTGVRNPWSLAPWRTFAEVAQPMSPFVLRFSQAETPEGGLWETGDGGWQVDAVEAIAEFLRLKLGDEWKVLG